MPRANTGRPTGTIPSRSRAMPSMTIAATPLFLAIMTTLSPTTAVAGMRIAGGDDDVAGLGDHQRRQDRQVVVGTGLARQRRTDEVRMLRVHRLDVMVERAAPLQRIHDMAGLRAFQLRDQFPAGPLKLPADSQ